MTRLRYLYPVLLIFITSSVVVLTSAQESVQIQTPDNLIGTIDNFTPYVEIPITVEQINSTIHITMQALDGTLDPQLYLVDRSGQIVAENNNSADNSGNSEITFKNAGEGDYRIIATRSGVADGKTQGDYSVQYDINPTDDSIAEYDVSLEALRAVGYPETNVNPKAKWTILAYYGGDSDLEAGILRDLNEFEQAGGSDENVRILALIDRNQGYTTERDNWTSTRLYEVRPNNSDNEETYAPLADLGDLNTGSGETLAQFLVWGINNYPADNYVLALASHGAGWQGIIVDNSPVNSIINLPQMQQALATTQNQTELDKFALLINDACLMSSVEYFEAVKPYFERSYASPEVVINPALDMMQFSELLRQPNVDLDAIGQQLVDTYILRDIQLRQLPTNAFMTHSVTNLNEFDGVTAAVEAFAAYINRDPLRYASTIGEARNKTYTYTFFASLDSQIDLGDFMDQVIASSNDDTLNKHAQAVLDALAIARVYGNGGEIVKAVSYYNIYFPRSSEDFSGQYFDDSPLKEWGRMLRRYYNAVTPRLWEDASRRELAFHTPVNPTIRITGSYPDVSSIHVPPMIEMEVTGRSIEQVGVTLDRIVDGTRVQRLLNNSIRNAVNTGDGIEILNTWNPGVDTSRFISRPAIPAVTDGTTVGFEFLEISDTAISLRGRYSLADNINWRDVTILFDLDGAVQRVLSQDVSSGAIADVNIPVGTVFQAYSRFVTADGQLREEPGNYYSWGDTGLEIRYNQPLPPGEYDLGFDVTSFGGSSDFDSVRISVSEDNRLLDASKQGYTSLDFGFTTLYPSHWAEPNSNGQIIEGYSPDGHTWIAIHRHAYIPGTLPGITTVVQQFHNDSSFRRTSNLEDIVVRGTQGVTYDIASNFGQNEWTGRSLVFAHPNRYGLVMQVMSREGAAESYEDVFETLVEGTLILDINQLNGVYDSLWLEDTLVDGNQQAVYPIHREWRWNKEIDAIWTKYSPGDTFSSIKVARLDDTDASLNDILTAQLNTNILYHDRAKIIETDTYHAQLQTWEYKVYTYILNDRQFIGRMYATRKGDDVYLIWMQSRDTDYGRDIFRETMEYTVDAFRVESVYQRYTIADAGITLAYPQNWYIPWNLTTTDNAGYWTSSPIGQNAFFRVYYDANLEACNAGDAVRNFFGHYPDHDLTELIAETEFDGAPAILFSTAYEREDGLFQSLALATCNENTALILTMEVPENFENSSELFAILLESKFTTSIDTGDFRSITDFN